MKQILQLIKPFREMRKIVALCLAFFLCAGGLWAQTTVTWPGTTALPGTATAVADDQNISIMVSSTNTYTSPIRIYANTTVTIEALNGAKILSVAYEASSTGNYVTNAQNATVTPVVTPTVNGKIVTWTYAESANVTEFTFKPTAQTRSNGITITYITSGGTPTCATPSFSPAAGTYTQAQNVSISCATEDATIYYTTNGDDPTTNSTIYSETISVSSEMTIKAMAAKSGYENSAIATADYAFITLEHAGTLADPYTVADARTAIDANAGTQSVYATGIVSAIPTEWSTQYNNITFNFVDNEGENNFLQAYRCVSGTGVDASTVAVGDVVVVYGNLTFHAASSTYEFGSGCQLVSLTHPVVTTPTVTVNPATINAPAEGAEGALAITYQNIPDLISFDYYFCDANGGELEEDPDWINAEINYEGDDANVSYTIDPNDGAARTAYFKVYTLVDEEEVYAIVTINQAEYVAPTYAELPFEFNGVRDEIENTDGLYQEGLGTDYNATTNPNTQLKFDGTGDWLLLQFDERPGTLTFDIKGNSFSGGTFKVQTSENGTAYTDLKTYTSFGSDVESEEFIDLGESVRYIKWIYTNKATGNVGLGNITLAEYEEPVLVPSITIDPNHIDLDANEHVLEVLPLTYENMEITGLGMDNFTTQFYDAEGEETEDPEWCSAGVIAMDEGGYQVQIIVHANEGEARSAYFKVYAYDTENNPVYSNLVTINQAAPVIDYAVLPFEWAGGTTSDFNALNGTSVYSVGDYGENQGVYRMKLDADNDYIQVKCDQQPGKVTIGVKMVGGSTSSTITVQGSADGETFTNIETLTISGTQNDILTLETTNVFGENDRYVRLLFTKGSNVGVGPITIAKGSAPSIVVSPATFDLEAAGPENGGNNLLTMTVAYHNLEITQYSDFAIQFYDADGEEQTRPDWIGYANVVGPTNDNYQIYCAILANDGAARSAFFKVYALDADETPVYSNLVTINQAAAPQQYALTVEPFENLEIITFVNDEMVLEADGEIQVNNGDHIMLSIVADEGYVMETLMVNGVNHVNDIAEDFTYEFDMPAEAVTINATAVEYVAPTPGNWVLTNLADLTEEDVFVIVGTANGNTYAMPNVGECAQGAPCVIAVTVVDGTLSEEPDAELQWNLGITEDGYIFYPNGDTENWLYCINNNNGVRVGDNVNNVFTMGNDGYLQHTLTGRYVGIFNAQDWRCYTNTTGNIAGQTFAFYKKMEEATPVTVTITGHTLETTYDGESHLVSGYDVVISDSLYTENDFTFSGTAEAAGTVVGTTYMNLEGEFQNTNPAFAVTFLVTDGYVTINPAAITVTVTGHTNTLTYNGSEQTVAGYDLSSSDSLFVDELVNYSGIDTARGTTVGTYMMNLEASLFSYGDTNIVVTFDVTDGWLTITPACEKIALDENGEWFEDFEYENAPTVNPTGVSPYCWTWTSLVYPDKVNADTMPQLHRYSVFAHSGNYSLRMWHQGIYAMPEIDTTIESVNQLQMSFYVRQPYSFYILQVGVMDDPTDPETFVPVAIANNGSSTEVLPFECNFSNYQGSGRYIAFKNVITDATSTDIHSTNYIDDLTLTLYEPATCGSITLGYEEDFENVTTLTTVATGVAPKCWDVVKDDVTLTDATAPQVYYKAAYANSGKYSLRMSNRCIYAMPELDENVDWSNVKLEMYVRQPNKCYQLHIGVWDEATEEFTPVAVVNNSTTDIKKFSCNFSNYTGNGRRIAFRNTLNSGANYNYSYNYIDDITLSLNDPAGDCADGITLPYEEDFDSYTTSTIAATGVTPDCWEMVLADVNDMPANKTPQVYYKSSFATSGSYTLRMFNRCVYAMPELAGDVELNTLLLTMNVRQPVKCYQLEVGVWEYDEQTQEGVFVPVETINNTELTMTPVTVDFSNYTGNGGRIAFRNSLNSGARYDYSYNYIDDIVLNTNEAKIAVNSNENVIDAIGVERYLEGIAVYPNPTVGELHIGATDVQKVECYNQMGQLVAVYDNENNISISNLANGVYMLRITVPQGVTMRKVVKR